MHAIKNLVLILLILFFFFDNAVAQKRKFKLENYLNEVSGVNYYSADSILWLNDGGNPNALYLTDQNGQLIREYPLPTLQNKDWEDLTYDDKGNVYIGDFGNNRNARKDLKIYIVSLASAQIDSISFNYPDQHKFPPQLSERRFDMEGFFWWDGSLHLFSKNKLGNKNYETVHYQLDDRTGGQTARKINQTHLKKHVVTAAAVNPDNKQVVLLSYFFNRILGIIPISRAAIYSITDYSGTDFLSGNIKRQKIPVFIFPTQYESIDFVDKKNVIIASERTAFIRARGKRIKLKK